MNNHARSKQNRDRLSSKCKLYNYKRKLDYYKPKVPLSQVSVLLSLKIEIPVPSTWRQLVRVAKKKPKTRYLRLTLEEIEKSLIEHIKVRRAI